MKKKGFTLVEIMIVVGIIVVIAGLSIPLMLRNRITANEAVAIASLKTMASACQGYYTMSVPHTYPPDLATLGAAGPTGPSYIDTSLASGQKSGYDFIYNLTSPVSFTVNANPTFPGRTGVRYFYTDETGRITGRQGGSAGPADSPV